MEMHSFYASSELKKKTHTHRTQQVCVRDESGWKKDAF